MSGHVIGKLKDITYTNIYYITMAHKSHIQYFAEKEVTKEEKKLFCHTYSQIVSSTQNNQNNGYLILYMIILLPAHMSI